MNMKTLIAASVAAAFAWPVSALAGGDNKAWTGAPAASGASAAGGEKMFQALDKDKDGSITKAEAAGTPHHEDFARLDKDGDGKLSREEHAAAPEHAGEKSGAGATSSGTSSGSGASQGTGSKKY